VPGNVNVLTATTFLENGEDTPERTLLQRYEGRIRKSNNYRLCQ